MLDTILIGTAWAISLALAFFLGFQCNKFLNQLKSLQKALNEKVDKPKEEQPKSVIIDELDPVQVAQAEHRKMMEQMNGRQ